MNASLIRGIGEIEQWRNSKAKKTHFIRVKFLRGRKPNKIQKRRREKEKVMGYVLRVRLASFFAGAAMASTAGLYILYKDYKFAHHSISDQVFLSHHLKELKFG